MLQFFGFLLAAAAAAVTFCSGPNELILTAETFDVCIKQDGFLSSYRYQNQVHRFDVQFAADGGEPGHVQLTSEWSVDPQDSNVVVWDVTVAAANRTAACFSVPLNVTFAALPDSRVWLPIAGPPAGRLASGSLHDPYSVNNVVRPDSFYTYGGHYMLSLNSTDNGGENEVDIHFNQTLALPVVSFMQHESDHTMTSFLDPSDDTRRMDLLTMTTADNDGSPLLYWSRLFHRLGCGTSPFRFRHLFTVTGGVGWRTPLRVVRSLFPTYFHAKSKMAPAGSAAYAGLTYLADEHWNGTALRLGNFALNWEPLRPLLYHGQWLGHVNSEDDPFYTCFRFGGWNGTRPNVVSTPDDKSVGPDNDRKPAKESCQRVTARQINQAYARFRKETGASVCSYGTVFEFGRGIRSFSESLSSICDADKPGDPVSNAQICEANKRLRNTDLKTGIFYSFNRSSFDYEGGGIVMDPGNDAVLDNLRVQGERLIQFLDADGICVDRQDFLGRVNLAGDDGQTWFQGRRASLLYNGWRRAIAQLGRQQHAAGRFVYLNIHVMQLHMLEHVDGFFDELGDWPSKLTGTAWLSLGNMPSVSWNHNGPAPGNTTSWLDYLQQRLYAGIWPMYIYPGNNHAVQPAPVGSTRHRQQQLFWQMGPLFRAALRGKTGWLLRNEFATIVRPSGPDTALLNAFETATGFSLVVVFAGRQQQTMDVDLNFYNDMDLHRDFASIQQVDLVVATAVPPVILGPSRLRITVNVTCAIEFFIRQHT